MNDKLDKILDGIDRTEDDNNGWWETSTGAEFGKMKKQEILDIIDEIRGVVS